MNHPQIRGLDQPSFAQNLGKLLRVSLVVLGILKTLLASELLSSVAEHSAGKPSYSLENTQIGEILVFDGKPSIQ